MFDGLHLYKVTNDNKIKPIDDDLNWNDIDKYLNNNICIIPENYVGVKDIKIEEINDLDTPFVYKNGKFIKLYEN